MTTWGMKDFRKLLPHRPNSIIQDWAGKEIALVSQKRAPGDPYETDDPFDLLDLRVVDLFSTVGMLDKPYKGPNRVALTAKEGNVCETFSYFPDSTPNDIEYPVMRSRSHAIDFYRKWDCQVLIAIDLMRTQTLRWPGMRSKRAKTRAKQGLLYYNVNYFRSTEKNIEEEVGTWLRGTARGKGPTLFLISVELLKMQVEMIMGTAVR